MALLNPDSTLGSPSHRYKLILLGEAGVGKSSLWYRFKTGRSPSDVMSTIGMDIATKTVAVDGIGSHDNETIDLNLWDTGGRELLHRDSTYGNYFRNVRAVLFVFSVDNVQSLTNLLYWVDDAMCYADNPVCFFLCNKVDLPEEDHFVYKSDIQSFLSMYSTRFGQTVESLSERLFYTSAKDMSNTELEKAVEGIAQWIHTPGKNGTRAGSKSISLRSITPDDEPLSTCAC